jgi:hypothetical protein
MAKMDFKARPLELKYSGEVFCELYLKSLGGR